jgi:MFS superfamily sulfate permease-like transporter
MFFFLAGIASLVLRWRGASGEVRQQIKWLAYFLATAGVMFIVVEIIGEMVYPAIFEGWFYLIELAIFWLGFPLVIGLAVFKYRLYDIDIIVRRTLQYALLTVLLGIIYFGVVIFLQQLFRSGTDDTSPLAIVISTLVIAALFNPLRKRVQEAIDRRFYRRKYDAQQALAAFAASARDEVDLEHLQVELLSIVQEAMQPEGVSLWLRPAKSHPFAGRENKDKS